MKNIKLYIYLFVALILQTTVINRFGIFGVFPNLIVIVAFLNSMASNSFDSVIYGFVCGFSLDLLSGKIIGLNAILVTYISFLITYINNKFVYMKSATVFIVIFLMTTLYQSLFVILNYTIWNIGTFLYALPKILIEALLNSIIAFVIYKIINIKTTEIVK